MQYSGVPMGNVRLGFNSARIIFYLHSQPARIIWLMIIYKLRSFVHIILIEFRILLLINITNDLMSILFRHLVLFFYVSKIVHKCIYHVVFFTMFAVLLGLRVFGRRRFCLINETTENIRKPFDVYFQRFNIRVQWLKK